ncbi:hypothetical protein HY024_03675 [Candidatus Curtissbacteria bacterium]|nr:hypothetical protein [Candidatus Curtissbacteria bacterium]
MSERFEPSANVPVELGFDQWRVRRGARTVRREAFRIVEFKARGLLAGCLLENATDALVRLARLEIVGAVSSAGEVEVALGVAYYVPRVTSAIRTYINAQRDSKSVF